MSDYNNVIEFRKALHKQNKAFADEVEQIADAVLKSVYEEMGNV